jgi:DNA-directed RNA polymerase specialized sigma24 family protein
MDGRTDGDRTSHGAKRSSRMRQLHALADGALVEAMRSGDPAAFQAFRERFAPLLEAYAFIMRIPTMDWPECIEDVLTDAAIRWIDPGGELPKQMSAYLKGMVRHAYFNKRRSAEFEAKIAALSESEGTEPVLRALYGDSTVQAARGLADEADECTIRALRALAVMLKESLSKEEQLVIGWTALRVPYRTIAELIGAGYEATSKRIQRLQRKLRDVAIAKHFRFSPDEQREIDRFLRRVLALRVLRGRNTEYARRSRRSSRQRVSERDRETDCQVGRPDQPSDAPSDGGGGAESWNDFDQDPVIE